MKGERREERIWRGRMMKREIFSACSLAKVFGVISPKTSTRNVIMPVVTPMAICLKRLIEIAAATTEAKILATLFPMRIVVKKRFGSFNQRLRTSALFPLLSIISLMRNLPREERAISLPEKRAEKKRRKIKRTICPTIKIVVSSQYQ